MMRYIKKNWSVALLAAVVGCAGLDRGCSSWCASAVGANWIIVQYNNLGTPLACWKLDDVSVDNEEHSDGIYWKQNGHLVHISGWYNRVQVDNGDFKGAAALLGIDLERCQNGAYVGAAAVVPEQGH
jgi:hypothetical protein